MTCKFCYLFGNDNSGRENRKLEDTILFESDNFVCVPAIGSILPMYLMIVTKDCYPSMALMPDQLLDELQVFSDRVTKKFPTYTIFEHGSSLGRDTSACIAHAHWHIVPHQIKAAEWDKKSNIHTTFKSFTNSLEEGGSYLLKISSNGQVKSTKRDGEPCQYFRRILANELDHPAEWDYMKNDYRENIEQTVKLLTECEY